MDDEEEEQQKSRTQLKREHAELREFGSELIGLGTKRLSALPLSELTLDAVLAAKTMKRAALQRQLRRIANLLEGEDEAAIRAAMTGPIEPDSSVGEAERWRDDLLAGDDDLLMEFVAQYPAADRRHLRRLVLNARKEQLTDGPSKAAEQVLAYIGELTTNDAS